MNKEPGDERPNWLLPVIFCSLILFGSLVAAGTYWSDPTPDWRKPLVVLGGLALFLGGWLGLLRSQRKRERQSSE